MVSDTSIQNSVLVAMSGGVDSTVTTLLLQKQGFNVTGVTFNLYKQDNPPHIQDARNAAQILNIPHHVMSLEEIFQDKIINYFIQSYIKGKTPNPCALCNRLIKFAALERKANELNIHYLATGHYANLIKDKNNNQRLTVSKDLKKSQEYFLALIPADILNRLIFPLSSFTKDIVRQTAHENNLEFFGDKPDSQEVCFLAGKSYVHFLDKQPVSKTIGSGKIISKNGDTLGKHQGYFRYTKGQRRGLGVALGKKQYVVSTNALTNEVVIGSKEDIEDSTLTVQLINIFDPIEKTQSYKVKIRYKSESQECKITHYNTDEAILKIEISHPHQNFFAPSPGQIAVIYTTEDIVIAAGEIQ